LDVPTAFEVLLLARLTWCPTSSQKQVEDFRELFGIDDDPIESRRLAGSDKSSSKEKHSKRYYAAVALLAVALTALVSTMFGLSITSLNIKVHYSHAI